MISAIFNRQASLHLRTPLQKYLPPRRQGRQGTQRKTVNSYFLKGIEARAKLSRISNFDVQC
jgi:hypothetical protein